MPGSKPDTAEPTQRTISYNPNSLVFSPLISSVAAAPLLMLLELPTVTVPPSRKTGFQGGQSFGSAGSLSLLSGGSPPFTLVSVGNTVSASLHSS
jgi:hypothetical protein